MFDPSTISELSLWTTRPASLIFSSCITFGQLISGKRGNSNGSVVSTTPEGIPCSWKYQLRKDLYISFCSASVGDLSTTGRSLDLPSKTSSPPISSVVPRMRLLILPGPVSFQIFGSISLKSLQPPKAPMQSKFKAHAASFRFGAAFWPNCTVPFIASGTLPPSGVRWNQSQGPVVQKTSWI